MSRMWCSPCRVPLETICSPGKQFPDAIQVPTASSQMQRCATREPAAESNTPISICNLTEEEPIEPIPWLMEAAARSARLPVRAGQSGYNGAVLQQHLHAPWPPLPGREMQRRGAVVVPDVDEPGETPAKLRQQRVSGTDISPGNRVRQPRGGKDLTMSRPPASSAPPRGWPAGSRHGRSRQRGAGSSARVPNRTSRYWRRPGGA
jgi:hypothetical protein